MPPIYIPPKTEYTTPQEKAAKQSTVRVLMLKTQLGSINGLQTVPFYEGKEYDLAESLVEPFISTGAIKLLGTKEIPTPPARELPYEVKEKQKKERIPRMRRK